MKRQESDPCRVCGIRPRVVTVTDIITGRATYPVQHCKHEVRLAEGLCSDCGKPHGGKHPARLRCDPCRERAAKRQKREWRRSPEGRAAVKRYISKDHVRAQRNEARRRWYEGLSPERRAAYDAKHRGKDRARRYRFGGEAYEETLRKKREYYERNRERILAKQRDRDKAA